jgi:branched-chain amino acid transport system ATP-binding protein
MSVGDAGPLLSVTAVTIRFGGLVAVSDFNLEMRPLDLVGLIGPNGAGKTTLFNMLTGVYAPTSGAIHLDTEVVSGEPPHRISRKGIARTFQNIRLFGGLSVLDNVRIGAHNQVRYGVPTAVLQTPRFAREEKTVEEHALSLLRIFGLETRAQDLARNLSYGDQRRLEICRALASRPRLLLLDEPAAGMNTAEAIALMATIREIRDTFHLAILLIEHNMEVVMGICERIVVLNYGRTIAAGPPAAIRKDPVVIAAYLGEPPSKVEGLDL